MLRPLMTSSASPVGAPTRSHVVVEEPDAQVPVSSAWLLRYALAGGRSTGRVVHTLLYRSVKVKVTLPLLIGWLTACTVTFCTSFTCSDVVEAWVTSTSVVSGSSPLGHMRVAQSTPEYPPSHLQPRDLPASHPAYLVPASSSIVSHVPCPLQSWGHVVRPHAAPLKPSKHSHSPDERSQVPRFEHSA